MKRSDCDSEKSFKCQGKEAYGFFFFLSQKFDKGEHIKLEAF